MPHFPFRPPRVSVKPRRAESGNGFGHDPETGKHRFIRAVLLLALGLVIVWGFSRHSKRISNAVDAAAPAYPDKALRDRSGQNPEDDFDATKTLSREQAELLRAYTIRFQERYGFPIIVRIRDRPFEEEEALALAYSPGAAASRIPPHPPGGETAPRALFLGLCPTARQVILHVPPLARTILGEDLLNTLRDTHFIPYFAAGNWPEGLAAALNTITRRLDASIGDRNSP